MGIKNKILTCSFIPELPWALFNPFFINRKLLSDAVRSESSHLSGKILDFGCGSKPYKSLFKFDQYIGVDIENPGHPHCNEQVDVFFDGKSLPFEDASFDACFSTEVFEHVFEIDQTMREIRRVLRPGGKVFVTTPFVWDEHEAPYDYCRYTSFGLRNVFERNGFEVLVQKKLGTFSQVILQLKLIYGNRKLVSNRILKYPFLLVLCPLYNLFSLLTCGKGHETIYLGNVIVAKKK